jgi:hypothetical protein
LSKNNGWRNMAYLDDMVYKPTDTDPLDHLKELYNIYADEEKNLLRIKDVQLEYLVMSIRSFMKAYDDHFSCVSKTRRVLGALNDQCRKEGEDE